MYDEDAACDDVEQGLVVLIARPVWPISERPLTAVRRCLIRLMLTWLRLDRRAIMGGLHEAPLRCTLCLRTQGSRCQGPLQHSSLKGEVLHLQKQMKC